jgi:hypothetical protein
MPPITLKDIQDQLVEIQNILTNIQNALASHTSCETAMDLQRKATNVKDHITNLEIKVHQSACMSPPKIRHRKW